MKLFARAALLSVVATALAPLSGCCYGLDACLACTNCLLNPVSLATEDTRADGAAPGAPTVTRASHMAY